MTSVRIDKWLWAARFFKTRALAARACELGRIQSNNQPVKPSREVRIGNMLRVSNAGGDFEIEVLNLSDVRGPAPVAQTLYRETEASSELRQKVAAERKAMMQFEQLPAGRPSKRDRRHIIQFRGRS
jgi:ribosome-associated heat shock protein Hsp15